MKKRTFIFFAGIATVITVLVIGCSKSSDTTGGTTPGGTAINCTGVTPTFSGEVSTLISGSCATNSSCHAAGSTNSGGPLTTYSQINAKSSNIKSQVTSGAMPQGATLTTAQKQIIVCWINNGAPNN